MIYYVNQAMLHDGDGSLGTPFRRISEAAKIAKPGDEVLVFPGVYREYVNPERGGTEDAPILYRSIEPLGAVICGAERIKGWTPYQGTVWTVRVKNSTFGTYNPYTTEVFGDWYFAPTVRHTGAVYLNDQMLYEAESLEECIAGEIYKPSWDPQGSTFKWFSEQDGDETVLYANFHTQDPNREKVEINVRRRCFFPEKTGCGYITVHGFKIEKAATTWAPPAAFQDGMIGPHWSKGWIIEDCEITNSKCCGISLGKYYDPENDHYFTKKHLKSPTQMERDAVCRGQYHGWLKENIGSHIIRRCNIHNCEQTGIVGRMGAVYSVIENNHIHHINNMQELGGAEISGIKLHAAIDVVIRRNHIHDCTMGVWCDWEAQGTRITQNLLHHNERPAYCTWCFDDYPTEQEWLDQFDLDVARPDMGKLEKYHFGHLPVWADGNAYFAGAKPWKKEKDCCVKSEKPYFMLVEREGQMFLDTDVAELIGAFRGGLVDSDTLGRAFEPDQRFEAADGSTIVFDSDFYGNHRGARVLPGPFATLDASMQPLF